MCVCLPERVVFGKVGAVVVGRLLRTVASLLSPCISVSPERVAPGETGGGDAMIVRELRLMDIRHSMFVNRNWNAYSE